ncbi:MAG: TetR/AcrR family transcriptional regulator [Kofleriaceae bacterium]
MARPPDPRAQRSRERMFAALVALIHERGWDKVSVREVCARAGVGRSTFYVHFADKEELLIGGLTLVRDAMRGRGRRSATRPFGFVPELVAHADGSRRLVRAVIGKRAGLAVQRRFRELVRELVHEELPAHQVPAARREATARFLAGALVELLMGWVDTRGVQSAADVEATFAQLAIPVLATARAR